MIDVYNKFRPIFIRYQLLRIIYAECVRRANRRKTKNKMGLGEQEFVLSATETSKFGLQKTQKGQIQRSIKKLEQMKFIENTHKKTSIGAMIYKLLPHNDHKG